LSFPNQPFQALTIARRVMTAPYLHSPVIASIVIGASAS